MAKSGGWASTEWYYTIMLMYVVTYSVADIVYTNYTMYIGGTA